MQVREMAYPSAAASVYKDRSRPEISAALVYSTQDIFTMRLYSTFVNTSGRDVVIDTVPHPTT